MPDRVASDRRLTPKTTRVAHVSLRGVVDSPAFTEGTVLEVTAPLTDLLTAPNGARDRQLLLGDKVLVLDEEAGHSFAQSQKDGHCGWIVCTALGIAPPPTHWLSAPSSHLYPEPRVQARAGAAIYLGSKINVLAQTAAWSETPLGFVPTPHLRLLTDLANDPASVAETLLGTPYLWGGNSRDGVDCSGLVQLSFQACGLPCPSDSDLQQRVGQPLALDAPLARNDLIFWKGHVALIVDETRLIHANGHSMSVAYEDTKACIARIKAQTGGEVLALRRP